MPPPHTQGPIAAPRHVERHASVPDTPAPDAADGDVLDRWLLPILARLLAPADVARVPAAAGARLWDSAVRLGVAGDEAIAEAVARRYGDRKNVEEGKGVVGCG
jgi:hypothetical protein